MNPEPDDEDCDKIGDWSHQDFEGLLDFVKSLWAYADCGYWGEDRNSEGRKYSLSTAGWSGNEDLVSALQDNSMFWLMCWVSSRRGGHYEFLLPARFLKDK